ncbi:MAG: hypothetical protein ACYC36_06715 [Bellilinea sp.]
MEAIYLDMLKRVPVFAVRYLLSSHVPPDINLKSMNRAELITRVDQIPAITPDMVEELYEDYRYGGRASFYLYLFKAHPNQADPLDVDSWNVILEDLQDENTPDYLAVKVIDTIPLDNGIDEIHINFRTSHQYEEVENGNLESIFELNHGFLWINMNSLYMVVMTRREEINNIIERTVHRLLNCIPVPVKLPKTFVNNQFPLEDISRGSWYDVEKDVSWTASGEDLMRKQGNEVRRLEENNERVAGLYSEQISQTIRSKLGVHLEKGKIYLTSTIRASALKTWMSTRLHTLILELQNLPPEDMIYLSSDTLNDLSLTSPAENFFQEIASGILKKRKNPEKQIKISVQPARLYSSLRSYFNKPLVSIFCDVCGTRSGAVCTQCGSGEHESNGGTLRCNNCGNEVSGEATVRCTAGHNIRIQNPERKLILKPKLNMQLAVARFIRGVGETYNDREEFFWIDSIELMYKSNDHQVEFLPDDIDEYRLLPKRNIVPDELWDSAMQKVTKLGEKCSYNGNNPTAADCLECNQRNLARLCIPKVFRTLSSSYYPTPHGGSEYGDVSMTISIKGARKSFIGLAKTIETTTRRGGVERPNQNADKWTNQILRQAIRDQAVETFGLIDPRPLNAEFRDIVRMLAKMDDKPFVIFGHEELTRMLCSMLLTEDHRSLREIL